MVRMASDGISPPDGAKDVVESNAESYNLEPGETFTGRLLNIRPTETEYGRSAQLTFELEDDGEIIQYFVEDEVKRAFKQDQLETGETYWIGKESTQASISSSGNTYFPVRIKQL